MSFGSKAKGFQVSLSDLQDEFNNMLHRMWHGGIRTAPFDGQQWAPSIDLADEVDRYVVSAEVPGLSVDDIEVRFEHGDIVLEGHKSCGRTEEERSELAVRERRFGHFSRRLTLAEPVRENAIEASCKAGVLVVVLPKQTPGTRRTINVEVRDAE